MQKKVIIEYRDGFVMDIPPGGVGTAIPTNAAIIIVEDCDHCAWSVGGRTNLVCNNPKTQAKRPYADDIDNGRQVDPTTRPEWCPL